MMTLTAKLDVDQIWKSLNQFGKFQLFQISLMLYAKLFHPFYLISGLFTSYRTPFRCQDTEIGIFGNVTPYDGHVTYHDGNATPHNGNVTPHDIYVLSYEGCYVNLHLNDTNNTLVSSTKCSHYVYDLPKQASMVSEWDIACNSVSLFEISTMLVMIGKCLGSFCITQFTDKFGRLKLNWLCSSALFTLGVGLGFSQNFMQVLVIRFFMGFMQQGASISAYIYVLETFPENVRFIVEIITMTLWPTGLVLCGVVSYLMQDLSWRYVQFTLALGGVGVLPLYWLIEESLRWLLANGRTAEAERVIRKAARWNKVSYDDVIRAAENKAKENDCLMKGTGTNETSAKTDIRKYTMIDMLKNRRILVNSLILWFIWITVTFGYYGLTFSSVNISGNRYLNFILVSLVEYPVPFVEYFLLGRFGRKKIIATFSGLAAVSLFTSGIILSVYIADSHVAWSVSLMLMLLGKFAVTGVFSVIFLFTPELYPTNMRNVGMGTASAIGRTGSIMAPFVAPLAYHVTWGPGVVIGSLFLLCTFLIFILPETQGKELPTTIEELKAWHRGQNDLTSADIPSTTAQL